MAGTRGPRFRGLSAGFAAYLLAAAFVTYFLSPTVSQYVDPGATRWIWTAYLLLGTVALVGACLGALRRAAGIDARIEELEQEERWVLEAATARSRASLSSRSADPPAPSDRDVDRLLEELEQVGNSASVDPEPGEVDAAELGRVLDEAAVRRERRGREVPRLRRARDAVAAAAAGPAVASLGVIGLFAALMPATDGLLLADLRLNAFFGLFGVAWLVGLAGYAAAAFRRTRLRAA